MNCPKCKKRMTQDRRMELSGITHYGVPDRLEDAMDETGKLFVCRTPKTCGETYYLVVKGHKFEYDSGLWTLIDKQVIKEKVIFT